MAHAGALDAHRVIEDLGQGGVQRRVVVRPFGNDAPAAHQQHAVGEDFANDGAWAADNAELGITAVKSGKYVSDVSVSNGTIVITFAGPQANQDAFSNGDILTLRPTVSPNGDIIWNCGYKTEEGADPASGGSDAGSTDVLEKYLPATCRA